MDWELLRTSFWPMLQGGLVGTIPLSITSFVLGLALALVVALMRISGQPVLAGIARFYVSVIRGTRCSCSCS
jgi:cystine transport system permease protein